MSLAPERMRELDDMFAWKMYVPSREGYSSIGEVAARFGVDPSELADKTARLVERACNPDMDVSGFPDVPFRTYDS